MYVSDHMPLFHTGEHKSVFCADFENFLAIDYDLLRQCNDRELLIRDTGFILSKF